MKTYTVTLARSETRIFNAQVEAKNEEEADEKAYELLDDIDFEDGETVHAENWVQEVTRIGK